MLGSTNRNAELRVQGPTLPLLWSMDVKTPVNLNQSVSAHLRHCLRLEFQREKEEAAGIKLW